MILQNIWKKVVGNVLVKISLSNILLTLLLPARFHQNCQAAFGCCEHCWVKLFHDFISESLILKLNIMLLVACLANQNDTKNLRYDKPWHMGTHLRVLGESFPMNTNMTGFRWFSKILSSLCFGWKKPEHWKSVTLQLFGHFFPHFFTISVLIVCCRLHHDSLINEQCQDWQVCAAALHVPAPAGRPGPGPVHMDRRHRRGTAIKNQNVRFRTKSSWR